MHSLPGGVRPYKDTLDEVLLWLEQGPRTRRDYRDLLGTRFGVTNEAFVRTSARLIEALGFAEFTSESLQLTPAGVAYLRRRSAEEVLERLHGRFIGLLESLVLAELFPGIQAA